MTALARLPRGACRTLLRFRASREIFSIFRRPESSFVPKRVLILTKISRYQIEKIANPQLSEQQLKHKLVAAGANYDAILAAHHRNKAAELKTLQTLGDLSIAFKIRNRHNVDVESIAWADLVLPVGGDGTFLLASNLLGDNAKPILGINSDPEFSEGFLMLPPKYTNNVDQVFEKLRTGKFEYLMRSRIRITLHGENVWQTPFHMHVKNSANDQEKFYMVHHKSTKPKGNLPKSRQLPWLALNEVFIGESLSARISTLHIDVGNGIFQKVKSSGMCVTTGTGSSSWYRAINSLDFQTVKDILRMAGCKENYSYDDMRTICFNYNSRLQYPAEQLKLSYVIRDMIVKHVWPSPGSPRPRGFCDKLIVRSQCLDGGLVIDGGIAVHFNIGTTAVFETLEQDALRNIVLLDC